MSATILDHLSDNKEICENHYDFLNRFFEEVSSVFDADYGSLNSQSPKTFKENKDVFLGVVADKFSEISQLHGSNQIQDIQELIHLELPSQIIHFPINISVKPGFKRSLEML